MMGALRAVMLAFGILATAMGLLWIGQGLGWVHWPASSFMLDQRPWAWRGALLAGFGLLLVLRWTLWRRR